MNKLPSCPVCQGPCLHLDQVDFNKTCEDHKAGRIFPEAGEPVAYALCAQCGFCFAPALCAWPPEEFSRRIYNDQYVLADPDYVDQRARSNAGQLAEVFGDHVRGVRHLDYGGGGGLLARLLREAGWQSTSYDPFADAGVPMESLGRFDFITAFEVFEHVPDPHQLVANLRKLLTPTGVVMFSTVVSDGNIRLGRPLDWWYAAPRNGHISLFSRNSLALLARAHELNFGSFSPGLHTLYTTVPAWFAPVVR